MTENELKTAICTLRLEEQRADLVICMGINTLEVQLRSL